MIIKRKLYNENDPNASKKEMKRLLKTTATNFASGLKFDENAYKKAVKSAPGKKGVVKGAVAYVTSPLKDVTIPLVDAISATAYGEIKDKLAINNQLATLKSLRSRKKK